MGQQAGGADLGVRDPVRDDACLPVVESPEVSRKGWGGARDAELTTTLREICRERGLDTQKS